MPDNPIQTPMESQINQLAAQGMPEIPVPVVNNTPILASNFQAPAVASDDDMALRYTQTVRVQVAENMMQDGALSGRDVKHTGMLMQVLKDMDAQAISKKRIRADEKTAGAASDISGMINRVLDSVNPKSFGVNPGHAPVDVAAREVVQDSSVKAVPGEMDVNPGQMNYNDFVGRMRGEPTDPNAGA